MCASKYVQLVFCYDQNGKYFGTYKQYITRKSVHLLIHPWLRLQSSSANEVYPNQTAPEELSGQDIRFCVCVIQEKKAFSFVPVQKEAI